MKLLLVLGLISTSTLFLFLLINSFQANKRKTFYDNMSAGQLCKYYPNETYLVVEILKIDEEDQVVFVQDKTEKLWKVQKSSLYPL